MSVSPKICHIAWGVMDVEHVGRGKDMKLWPGGGREWDWRETGTHHRPGIQAADVEELVEHGADVVVLSRGMLRRLRTTPETLEYLREHDVDVRVEETKAAVELYNRLANDGEAVGGLFHSTC
jgi:hypothetical protein